MRDNIQIKAFEHHAQDSRCKPIVVNGTLGSSNGDCLLGKNTLVVKFIEEAK